MRGGKKSVGFLVVTVLVLSWEVHASRDGDPSTCTWTELIVTYIPGEVTAVLIGGLLAWLPVHFGIRYWRKGKSSNRGSGHDTS